MIAKIWILGSLKSWRIFFQDILLSQIVPRKLNFALSLRKLSSISTWHNNLNFNNSFRTKFSGHPFDRAKTMSSLLTRIYCSWWRQWPRATHPVNFVNSNQDFHIEFVKSAIDLKIHKYLRSKPGSSQNGIFQWETGRRELSCQNGRVGTNEDIIVNSQPFRPIFSAINTPAYKLGEFLVPILSLWLVTSIK